MAHRTLPLSEVYGLLEPGPVLLMSTAHRGRANVMTLSWQTMLEFEPPLVGVVVSAKDFSHTALRLTRQCVLNLPGAELADAVVGCGNTSGRATDKFAAFGLTALPSATVAPPRIAQCHAQLECRVVDTRLMRRYDFFVLEVVQAWLDPRRRDARTLHHRGRGAFMLAGETIRLPSAMR